MVAPPDHLMDPSFLPLLCYSALCIACFQFLRQALRKRFRASIRCPPGPRLGSLLSATLHREFWRVKAVCGNFVYMRVFNASLLFVNSYEQYVTLLERRSSTYSSRPRFIMPIELSGWSFIMLIMPYSRLLKNARMFSHSLIPYVLSPDLRDLLEREVRTLIRQLDLDALDYEYHLRRFPASVLLMATQGYKAADGADPVVQQNYTFTLSFFTLLDDSYFLNFIPWITKLPSWLPSGLNRIGRRNSAISRSMLNAIRGRLTDSKRYGNITSGFTYTSERDGSFSEEEMLTSLGSIQTAGPDTGQEELDTIIGKDRLPLISDRSGLPYIRAICREVLRWEPILPLVPPRIASENDVVDGYFIPKGTHVLVNVWAILHNPKDFPDPMAFKPERWLSGSEEERSPPLPERVVFGTGRRVCVGRVFAENAIFLAVASILSMYNIEPAKDTYGRPIPVKPSFTNGVVHRLKKFPFTRTRSVVLHHVPT
ncbi:cytochrome P450 [Schizopora paradoxa]|uniref:Cytochrome P450 n=1 Tax=Schizopora paradoxa TaxID=27342 RepID=A0A0H2RP68_9AGAM|nr:cytochrome P450 [Schizopora paradoxa]